MIDEIRRKQAEIILMVNSAFDEIVNNISKLDNMTAMDDSLYEISYPITNATGFKGKKVIGIIINGNREKAPTWKIVVKKLFAEVIKDETMKKRLYDLSDKILGRKRTRLSSNKEDMYSPLEIDKNLFIETHYDTETLMKMVINILDEICYDYSKINVVIKN